MILTEPMLRQIYKTFRNFLPYAIDNKETIIFHRALTVYSPILRKFNCYAEYTCMRCLNIQMNTRTGMIVPSVMRSDQRYMIPNLSYNMPACLEFRRIVAPVPSGWRFLYACQRLNFDISMILAITMENEIEIFGGQYLINVMINFIYEIQHLVKSE